MRILLVNAFFVVAEFAIVGVARSPSSSAQFAAAMKKAVKPFAEKMISLGKRGDLHARRKALAELRSQDVVHNLFAEVAPRFAERPGGYTRIIKLGQRYGDAAEMVYLELVDYEPENALAG